MPFDGLMIADRPLIKIARNDASLRGALATLGKPLRSYQDYRDWLDGLYFLFRESVGQRLDGAWPQSFAEVNTLRTAVHHDVDHGKARKVAAKRLAFGKVFKKYAGVTTPSTLAPESFVVVRRPVGGCFRQSIPPRGEQFPRPECPA